MRSSILLAAAAAVALGCSDPEVVVTRDQFGEAWPLEVNSARVVCGESRGARLELGVETYALDATARAAGYPDAREVARQLPVDPTHPEIGTWPADVEPLRAVCDAQVAASR